MKGYSSKKYALGLIAASIFGATFSPIAAAKLNSNIGECDLYSLFEANHRSDYVVRKAITVRYNGYTHCVLDQNNLVNKALSPTTLSRKELESDASTKLYQMVKSNLNSSFDLRYVNTSISGPISAELAANNYGTITAKVGGFGINSKAKITLNNVPSDVFSAYGTISLNPVWAQGNYNFATGKLSNFNAAQTVPSVDFETRFFGIPIPAFGYLVQNELENLAERKLSGILSRDYTPNKTLFSLNEVIPTGEFFYGGQDLGVKAKDKLIDLIGGESIKVEISGNSLDSAYIYLRFSNSLEIQVSSEKFKNPLGPDKCPNSCV